jgi:mannose-6-phosphate isomerase-like protein (cupin superfamily)
VVNQPTRTLTRFESHITTLLPGKASHEPHRHPQEELILLKEGRLEVHLNGQTQEVGPGSVMFFASNDAHAVRNIGSGPATYWVINLTTPATLRAPDWHIAATPSPPSLPQSLTPSPPPPALNPTPRHGVHEGAKQAGIGPAPLRMKLHANTPRMSAVTHLFDDPIRLAPRLGQKSLPHLRDRLVVA